MGLGTITRSALHSVSQRLAWKSILSGEKGSIRRSSFLGKEVRKVPISPSISPIGLCAYESRQKLKIKGSTKNSLAIQLASSNSSNNVTNAKKECKETGQVACAALTRRQNQWSTLANRTMYDS
jgi:hypothetical protein